MPICGKHRGTVVNNVDPQGIGRIQVNVPDVPGAGSFAMPSLPYAGKGVGFLFLPPVGASVWVEFEAGNPDLPIWTGCFWGAGDAPAQDPQTKVFKTDSITMTWNDQPNGGFTLTVGAPVSANTLTLVMNKDGIVIDNGAGANISLAGPTVSVNRGELTVT